MPCCITDNVTLQPGRHLKGSPQIVTCSVIFRNHTRREQWDKYHGINDCKVECHMPHVIFHVRGTRLLSFVSQRLANFLEMTAAHRAECLPESFWPYRRPRTRPDYICVPQPPCRLPGPFWDFRRPRTNPSKILGCLEI